ncbi:MAG: ferredoxin--NADP+ reductase [Cognaticolwellia sp.]
MAYHKIITADLPHHEYLGNMITEQLIYYPNVTRESYKNEGHITDLIKQASSVLILAYPELDPEFDCVMLCGSPAMLKDTCAILDEKIAHFVVV